MEADAARKVNLSYERIPAHTYAFGVARLRAAGEQPKTLAQNMQACITTYKNGERARIFGFAGTIYSSTGVVIKQDSTKIKIVQKSEDLITIPEDFSGFFIPVVYDKVEGIELNVSCGKYNQTLRKGEPLIHEGWLKAVDDFALLIAFHDVLFKRLIPPTGMAFCVPQFSINTDEDKLGVLCLDPYTGSLSFGRTSYLTSYEYFLCDSSVRATEGVTRDLQGIVNKGK